MSARWHASTNRWFRPHLVYEARCPRTIAKSHRAVDKQQQKLQDSRHISTSRRSPALQACQEHQPGVSTSGERICFAAQESSDMPSAGSFRISRAAYRTGTVRCLTLGRCGHRPRAPRTRASAVPLLVTIPSTPIVSNCCMSSRSFKIRT